MRDEVAKPTEGSTTEPERVLAELKALDRAGKLDDAALARLDARMQTEFARLDREHARIVAEIENKFGSPAPVIPRGWRRMAVLIGTLTVVAGVVLETTLGQRFICTCANDFRSAMPWLFPATFLLVSIAFIRSEGLRRSLRFRYPTWWIRWLTFPLTVALLSGAVVVAPLGWAAAWGWMAGRVMAELDGKVLATREWSSRDPFSCSRKAILEVGRASAEICVEQLVSGAGLKAGDAVVVVGRVSAIGVFVETIRKRPVASTLNQPMRRTRSDGLRPPTRAADGRRSASSQA